MSELREPRPTDQPQDLDLALLGALALLRRIRREADSTPSATRGGHGDPPLLALLGFASLLTRAEEWVQPDSEPETEVEAPRGPASRSPGWLR